MKRSFTIIICLFTLLICSGNLVQALTLTKQTGWLESAYITWTPVSNAVSYNVYYSGGGFTSKQIDNKLIRSYGTYFRADIPGLKSGEYIITVKAVNNNGVEFEETTSSSITVLKHDRTGFAFANNRVPGAYKTDGTLKDDALVVYVTEKSKDTVSLAVKINSKGGQTTFSGLQNILYGFKKGYDNRPLAIRFIGQITGMSVMEAGDIVIENNNNSNGCITLEGIGDDAVADGWGIRVKNADNVEIRNLGFMNCYSNEGDNVGLQQGNKYVWVHNCDMFYGDAGSDADQVKGDGALDCKKSNYCTFSYNHFWDNGKCNLLGLSENQYDLYVTYHHNWYDHSDSRHPRVRFFSVHVYNNYYDGNAKYGTGACMGSSIFSEANYFRNCKYPLLISMQGSDVWNSSTGANDYKNKPTFSGENGGIIKAYNNYMTGETRFVPYGAEGYTQTTTVDFDAYVASGRDEIVPATVKTVYGNNTYNNFDTNSSIMYSYTPDAPTVAKENVMSYAGRVEGGDFKWTFDNAVDDASYAVNTALKNAITSYTTSLVNIQGESSSNTPTDSTNHSSIVLTTTGSLNQTIYLGSSIASTVVTASGSATSIDVDDSDLPAGVSAVIKGLTVTLSGTPTFAGTYTYTVAASDSSSTKVISGTIIVLSTSQTTSGGICTLMNDNSSVFAISGNTSTSKGSVTVNETTYDCCLKLETTTNISFTTAATSSTLYLVFPSSFAGKKIKIDGIGYAIAADGSLTVTLNAGIHTITKGDSVNLFYISLTEGSSSGIEATNSDKSVYYSKGIVYNTNNLDIQIFSTSGKLIYSGNGNYSFSNNPYGIYLIRVVNSPNVLKIAW